MSAETAIPGKTKSAPWTSNDVLRALRARHDPRAWAFLAEVRNETGFATKPRTADAIAMSLWPSRGLELHGFEVKVSRADWQKELADPSKAEAVARYCDRWWVACGSAEIVREGELPETWGLLVRRGDALVVKKQAPKLAAQALTREFIASLFREVAAQVSPAAELERVRIAARLEGRKDERERVNYEHKRLDETVAEFEKEVGLKLADYRSWTVPELGKAVREVLSGRHLTLASEVEAFEKAAGLKIAECRWPEPYAREVGEAVRLVLADRGNGHGADALRRRLEGVRRELEGAVKAIGHILDGPPKDEAKTEAAP